MGRSRRFSLAVVFLVLLLARPGLAGGRELSPAELWHKMVAAKKTVGYQGNQVVITWENGNSRALVFKIYRRGTKTRWEFKGSPHGAGTVVIDDGYHAWELINGGRLVILHPSSPETTPAEEELLFDNYFLKQSGEGVVAGVPAQVLELIPRFSASPWYRIWVDPATGVVLRRERYRSTGELVEMAVFTEIQFYVPEEEVFTPQIPKGAIIQRAEYYAVSLPLFEMEEKAGFKPWLPARLPPGYTLTRSYLVSGRTPVLHLEYSDGLNYISLFQYPAEGRLCYPPQAQRIGWEGTQGYLKQEAGGWTLCWNTGGYVFTIIGDLPPEELMQMAATVQPQQDAGREKYVFSKAVSCLRCRGSRTTAN